jgi:hypothetical protein
MSIREFHAKLEDESDETPGLGALRKIRELDRERLGELVLLDWPYWEYSAEEEERERAA